MSDPTETPTPRDPDAFHRHVSRSIDWNPTCLPGTERVTIVRQIVQQADERRCRQHEDELAALRSTSPSGGEPADTEGPQVADPAALVARLVARPFESLMPWPEASQDLALLAFMIDQLRSARAPLPVRACDHTAPLLFGDVAVCVEPAGHRMPHRSDRGTTWEPAVRAPVETPEQEAGRG